MIAEAWPKPRRFTPEEYLEIERKSTFKSEYLNGQILAMAGGDPKHSAIANNIQAFLTMQLLDTTCQVFNSDLKIRTTPSGLFAYPDVSIVCGELEFHDNTRDVITNLVVIVDVLSPSTASYDRIVKFDQYRQLPTLRDYLLVEQNVPVIHHFARHPDDAWMQTPVRGLDSEVHLTAFDAVLRLADVYRKITFAANTEENPAS